MDSTTFGLSPKKLARLLRLGSGRGSNASKSDNRVSLLTQLLETTLTPEIIPGQSSANCPIDRMSVARLLKGPTDLAVIIALKDYAKAQVAEAGNKAHGDVATTIYYGCIASALVQHGQQISTLSYQELGPAFLALLQKDWMHPQLALLLKKARAICEQRMDSQ